MRLPVTLMVAAAVMTACGPLPVFPGLKGQGGPAPTPTSVPGVTVVPSAGHSPAPVAPTIDTPANLGGLPTDIAAHFAVEMAQPRAFALTPDAGPFLQALARSVDPLRQQLAQSLLADPTVSQGLVTWASAGQQAQIAVLQRVATIEGEVMGCQVPPLVVQAGGGGQSGTLAFFTPGPTGIGQIVLYPDAIGSGDQYPALATVVHEMRHAAQFQMTLAPAGGADPQTLATAYAECWDAMDSLGGETQLAYGDYAHLNVEFDAFQTGNEVAAIVSGGRFDSTGYGFVDTRYDGGTSPVFDLAAQFLQVSGTALFTAVNQAEYAAENRAASPQRQPNPRGRHTGGRFSRHSSNMALAPR